MATTVGLIKGATEVVLGIGEVSIDNFTFKLFYKWSVSLFIAGSVAVCSSQFFGDPVACETVSFLDLIKTPSYCQECTKIVKKSLFDILIKMFRRMTLWTRRC